MAKIRKLIEIRTWEGNYNTYLSADMG